MNSTKKSMPYDAKNVRSDEYLLGLYTSGEPTAAKELVERFSPQTLRLAARMLGDPSEAEEVAQEAMIRLWKIAPSWQHGRAKVSTWLWRVTINLCTDRLRRRKFVGIDQIPDPEDDTPHPDEKIMVKSRVEALQAALMKLPDRQRSAVILRHIEEVSNQQIAETLNISVEAVESLTARGIRSLKAQLLGKQKELGWKE